MVIGNRAGYNGTTSGYNVIIGGIDANGVLTGNSIGTGTANVAVGAGSMGAGTASAQSNNTAVGYHSLWSNTGDSNVAMGYNAALNTSSGSNNVALGLSALSSNTTGSNSTAVGHQALFSSTLNTNTALGYRAGYGITTGYDNTLIGENAGFITNILTTGEGNICIGTSTRTSAADSLRQINIGYGVTGQANDNVTLGSFQGKIYNAYTSNATWTQTSDGRLKTNVQDDSLGLSFINRLRPVKFKWKPSNEIDQSLPYYNATNQRNTETVIHGLIAQEVKAALDAEGVSTFAGWDVGSDGVQAISREMFISPLIKAIQELSAQVETLKSEIATLKGA